MRRRGRLLHDLGLYSLCAFDLWAHFSDGKSKLLENCQDRLHFSVREEDFLKVSRLYVAKKKYVAELDSCMVMKSRNDEISRNLEADEGFGL